jgi:hypothetical protein
MGILKENAEIEPDVTFNQRVDGSKPSGLINKNKDLYPHQKSSCYPKTLGVAEIDRCHLIMGKGNQQRRPTKP